VVSGRRSRRGGSSFRRVLRSSGIFRELRKSRVVCRRGVRLSVGRVGVVLVAGVARVHLAD
jgi:hypothetical protein